MVERGAWRRALGAVLLMGCAHGGAQAQADAGAAPASASTCAPSAATTGVATTANSAPSSSSSSPSAERCVVARAVPTAADPALEARMLAITGELRCLVCQNQTIADSHADLAVDLRQETREMIARGLSDDQIRRYMTARYGDFILYRPPFKTTTLVLWLGPALLLALAVAALAVVISRRARLADDHFEADPGWDDEDGFSPRPKANP